MNSLPVSLDLTTNSSTKPPKKGSDSAGKGTDPFKNELKKQENETTNKDKTAKVSSDNSVKNEQANTHSEAATVAGDETTSGEDLPQQGNAELTHLEDSAEQSTALDIIEELDIPTALSLIKPEDTPNDEVGLAGIIPDDLGYSMLGVEEAGYSTIGQSTSLSGAVNAVASSVASGDANTTAQPLEKLMTLEQLKASLEKSVDALAEFEVDVDTDSEGNIREVFRFNDIQLKESQSSLKTYTTSVDLPVAPGGWSDKVNEKIMWLANQKIQFAEIHLNPQDLGPMEVKINVQNEQATVTFTSHNQGVRELLESNVNRLREMMNENGVDLAHVDVSDQSPQQQSSDEQTGGVGRQDAEGESELSGHENTQGTLENLIPDNLVDYYA